MPLKVLKHADFWCMISVFGFLFSSILNVFCFFSIIFYLHAAIVSIILGYYISCCDFFFFALYGDDFNRNLGDIYFFTSG